MTLLTSWKRNVDSQKLLLGGLLFVLALIGGSSRADEPVQIVVRLIAVAALATAILLRPVRFDQPTRLVALALAVAGLTIALQLIPLPPRLWSALPGRSLYAEQDKLVGMTNLWRPLTLSPDRTWNALLSLLVPLAAVALTVRLNRRQRHGMLPVLVAALGVATLVQLVRLMTGSGWPFYFLSIDAGGSGMFANRNHQALWLAMGFPLLATWVVESDLSSLSPQLRQIIAGMGAITLMILIPATGSRTGLVLGTMAIAMAVVILWKLVVQMVRRIRRRTMRWLAVSFTAGVIIGTGALAVGLSRAEGVRRLMSMDVAGDTRTRLLPRVLEMTALYFPAGVGFGSFEPAFRRFERLQDLKQTYFNQAHDDLLQIVLEGGALGAVLLVAALTLLFARSIRVWRGAGTSRSNRMARLASFLLALMVAASVVDYPLRTPFLSALAALVTIWLFEPTAVDEQEDGSPRRGRRFTG
jgi:hypothetical protein